MDVSPPETLKNPIHVPQKLLMGPGPSNVSQRVLNAQALPTLGHLHTEFCKVISYFLGLLTFSRTLGNYFSIMAELAHDR